MDAFLGGGGDDFFDAPANNAPARHAPATDAPASESPHLRAPVADELTTSSGPLDAYVIQTSPFKPHTFSRIVHVAGSLDFHPHSFQYRRGVSLPYRHGFLPPPQRSGNGWMSQERKHDAARRSRKRARFLPSLGHELPATFRGAHGQLRWDIEPVCKAVGRWVKLGCTAARFATLNPQAPPVSEVGEALLDEQVHVYL